CLQPLEFPWTF
nr:immunoglobulin light chain junction region [Macaca mulatta]MOV77969.1 immunoglobulin light chain junction region [Macaca mulatta]MOV78087.1 immunoglobulin light chain junction region [Macaca mulatta]MOV78791.1 immunoglobulin light chain junction region [Macaca mulatta]MOV79047.1 immunoglobulin light chain junction region [Macaca mulatta]